MALACVGVALGADEGPEAVPDDAFGQAFESAFDAAYRDEVALAGEPGDDAAGTLLVVLDAGATFGRGGAALPGEARVGVERLARRLAALDGVLSVRVIGHADSVGTESDNLALSERRARSVADTFRERWPEAHTLALGAGESTPIADNATEAGRAANRRVEIQVIGIGRPEDFGRDDPVAPPGE